MKLSNFIFFLHWIAILVAALILIPKLNLLSFDDIAEAGLFGLGLVGTIFFVVAHGMLTASFPKTKTGVSLLVLGFAQMACSVFLIMTYVSPNHGEMGLFFAFLYATAVAIVSLPFAIAALVQRARAKRALSGNSL